MLIITAMYSDVKLTYLKRGEGVWDRQTTKVGQDLSNNQLGHSNTAAAWWPVNDAWKRSLAGRGRRSASLVSAVIGH